MTTSSFIEKINWRLLVTHFFATIFIMLGARQFSFLTDRDLVESFSRYGIDGFINHVQNIDLTIAQRLTYFLMWTTFSVIIGLIISFIISLTISIRKKIFWLNSLIVLLACFYVHKFGLLNLSAVKTISNSFGDLFINLGLQFTFIINGGLLTILGLLLLLNRWTNKFILKQYNRQTSTFTADSGAR